MLFPSSSLGGQQQQPTTANDHFLLQPLHSPNHTVVVIEELDSPVGRLRLRDVHGTLLGGLPSSFGADSSADLFGGDGPQSASPTGLSSASTTAFDWLEVSEEGQQPTAPAANLGGGSGSESDHNNFLRGQSSSYFEQAALNGQQVAAIYGTAATTGGGGGVNHYYQHYQPSSLAVQHLHQQQQAAAANNSIQVVHSSATNSPSAAGCSQQTFVLRQQATGPSKSLSPDISVDENCTGSAEAAKLAGGGGGGRGSAAGSQSQQGHTARTPPETLEWLQANYEEFKGASLPRCTLYEHYQNHCREAGLVPVNAASFGKLIRSVFKSLQTRRLGTRGNSKYHYNGIRVKPESPLAATMSQEEFQRMSAAAQQPTGGGGHQRSQRRHQQQLSAVFAASSQVPRRSTRGMAARGNGGLNSSSNSSSADERNSHHQMGEQQQAQKSPHYGGLPFSADESLAADGSNQRQQEIALPEVKLPSLDEGLLLQFGLGLEHALKFFDDYREHSREVLDCVKHGRLELVEGIWMAFWQQGGIPPETHQQQHGAGESSGELGQLRGAPALDRHSLFRLCSLPQVLAFVQAFDLKFYQLIVDLLFPCPLRLSLPGDLCNRVRHFGKSVECWMDKALGTQAPQCLRRAKLGCAQLLANSLTRLSSFAHLAITARNVLQNEAQVQQMHDDFSRVDFGVVHWQADWLCSGGHCPPDWPSWVRDLLRQFRERLARRCSLDEWADWLEAVADRALASWADQPLEAQQARCKRFLLGWTFHSSLLLRDITLRSAQSFGQFHLVRLLFDDFLLLCMEQKLAKLAGQETIGLMAPEWLRASSVQLNGGGVNGNQQSQPHHQHQPFPSLVSTPSHSSQSQASHVAATTFYAQMHHQPQSSQFRMVDQLPPPGPEPPLDMLNGSGEDHQQPPGAMTRNSAATTTIRYVLVRQEGPSRGGCGRRSAAETEEDDWEMVAPDREEDEHEQQAEEGRDGGAGDQQQGRSDRAVKMEGIGDDE